MDKEMKQLVNAMWSLGCIRGYLIAERYKCKELDDNKYYEVNWFAERLNEIEEYLDKKIEEKAE